MHSPVDACPPQAGLVEAVARRPVNPHGLWILKGVRVNTPTTAALVGLGLVANLAAGSPMVPLGLAVVSGSVLTVLGVSPLSIIRRLAIPWYLATVAAGIQVFLFGSTPLFNLGPFTAYAEGVGRGLLMASKVLGGSTLVLALSLTTPPTELLGLALRLRVPPILVEIAMLIYRYLFLLGEEAQRIRDAQRVRLGDATWARGVAAFGNLAGMVMVSAYDRAERVYQAMLVRGYSGAIITEGDDRHQALRWPLVLGTALLLAVSLWAGG